jgi:hypothetical protein
MFKLGNSLTFAATDMSPRMIITICLVALSMIGPAWSTEPSAKPQTPESTPTPIATPESSVDRTLGNEQAILIGRFRADIEKSKGPLPKGAVAKPAPPPRAKKARWSGKEIETNQYDGYLGDAAVKVSLTISRRTRKVAGDLYFLRVPTRLYTLTGQNVREGRFRLTLLNNAVPIAAVTLQKTKEASVVKWEGELHDSEGKTYSFFLTRAFSSGAPLVGPRTVSDFDSLAGYQLYKGSVDNRRGMIAGAFFKLKFSPGRCSGFYYQRYPNGQTSTILRLDGENKRHEKLELRETDNDKGYSAILDMTKVPLEVSPTKIIWKGTLTNIRDNNDVKDVEFSRPR